MQQVVLNNGIKMPILGFGVYQIADGLQCQQAVLDALEIGYRLIDTAASYRNEEAVGRAIAQSDIARDDLFITTKLWVQDVNYESAKKALQKSLDRLGMDYLDLYLIHQPFNDYYGAWRAMEEMVEQGLIRAIGVSNFFPDRLVDLISHNKIVPAVNQIETHPFYQRTFDQQIMKEHGVQIESWGPFAEGRNKLFENDVLKSIAEQYNKSVAQVVLRWLIQRDVVCIPKSTHKERIAENFNVFDFELTDQDMATISTMDTDTSSFFDHRDPEKVKWLSNVTLDI